MVKPKLGLAPGAGCQFLALLRATCSAGYDGDPWAGWTFAQDGEAEQARVKMRWEEKVSGTPNALFRRIDVRVLDARGERTLAILSGFAVRPLR